VLVRDLEGVIAESTYVENLNLQQHNSLYKYRRVLHIAHHLVEYEIDLSSGEVRKFSHSPFFGPVDQQTKVLLEDDRLAQRIVQEFRTKH